MIDRTTVDPGGSVRHCCRVLGLRRASYHHRKSGHRPELADNELADLLRRTTECFVSWGFWKVYHYLRQQRLTAANHKRVYRIWCRERLNLRLPPRRPRIYRTYQELISPDGINEGWAMDFVSDYVVGPTHKRVRIVNVMDEGSRRALWTEAFDSISARTLLTVLDRVVDYRGRPAYIRCDNGPEFISRKLRSWAEGNGIELRFIQPGKPTQNGLIERLNKTLRAECLNLTWFRGVEELNDELQAWSQTYNLIRPHENLGHISPEIYELENQKFYYSVVAA
ncbi:IS3 family transposase [Lewinella sp. IMCC34183]|uniref:IS3 family transposase n=1 Tax=Lewinella sp. IMCC34183 TaxID=2248762 RepID=UPI000E267609|nr:IS3 family transposase [Lewinella sp. IMCC34183]